MARQTIGKVDIIPKDSMDVKWRIENFLFLTENSYVSPVFFFADASWCIDIYPDGDTVTESDSLGFISLYLTRTSRSRATNVEYSFGLKTAGGEKYGERQLAYVFSRRKKLFGFHCFLPRWEVLKRRSELLPSNILTVVCTMKDLETSEFEDTDCPPGSSNVQYQNKVLHDFKDLFLNKEDCDVVIKVQGEEFPAHRTILKARSSVFASTFRCDMKEKATGIVEIEDCDPSSFSDFLFFLYCGEVRNLSGENVFSLFYTAGKYDVQDLRTECMDFLKQNLSVDSFCDTISLALRHSERELIKLATDFFTNNAPNIILTVQWQSFLAENPTESNELLVKLLIPNSSKLSN